MSPAERTVKVRAEQQAEIEAAKARTAAAKERTEKAKEHRNK